MKNGCWGENPSISVHADGAGVFTQAYALDEILKATGEKPAAITN